MQLILETDNPSLSLKEKMSALEQHTLAEKPLTNGDANLTEEPDTITNENDVKDKENNVQNGIQVTSVPEDNEAITSANISEDASSEIDSKQELLKPVYKEINIENNLNNDPHINQEEEIKESQMDIEEENQPIPDLDVKEDEKCEPMDVDVSEEMNENDFSASLNALVAGIVTDIDQDMSQDNLDEIKLETENTTAVENQIETEVTKQTAVPVTNDIDQVEEKTSSTENIDKSVDSISSIVPKEVDQVPSHIKNSLECIDETETGLETIEANSAMTTAVTAIVKLAEVDGNSIPKENALESGVKEKNNYEEIKDISEISTYSKSEVVEIVNLEKQNDRTKLNDKQDLEVSESLEVVKNKDIESNIEKENLPEIKEDIMDIDSQGIIEITNADAQGNAINVTNVKNQDNAVEIIEVNVQDNFVDITEIKVQDNSEVSESLQVVKNDDTESNIDKENLTEVKEDIVDIDSQGNIEITNADAQNNAMDINVTDVKNQNNSVEIKEVNVQDNSVDIAEAQGDSADIDVDAQDNLKEIKNISFQDNAVTSVDNCNINSQCVDITEVQGDSADIDVDAQDNLKEMKNITTQDNAVTSVDDSNINSHCAVEITNEDNVTKSADTKFQENSAETTDVQVHDNVAYTTDMEIQKNSADITDIEVKDNCEGIADIDVHDGSAGILDIDGKGDSAGITDIEGKGDSAGVTSIDVRADSINITEADVQDNTHNKATPIENDEVVDLDGIEDYNSDLPTKTPQELTKENQNKPLTPLIKLSNTLDILSDDEEEPTKPEKPPSKEPDTSDKQCINLDDDDDIMLIDDTPPTQVDKDSESEKVEKEEEKLESVDNIVELEKETVNDKETDNTAPTDIQTEPSVETKVEEVAASPKTESKPDETTDKVATPQPLIPQDFFKGYRKNLADMTRDDLEEFCLIKIVESIIDRSNLNEIRTKLKTMAANIEEYKKKAMLLSKQNRDLQVVLKSIQEEQKKNSDQPIVPLKITRSVGMQVLMNDKTRKRHMPIPTPSYAQTNNVTQQINNAASSNNSKPTRNQTRILKGSNNQPIPVPRLVPAGNNTQTKNVAAPSPSKVVALQNGLKLPPLAAKAPEKRTYGRMQSPGTPQSVTVDLTDDEPPSKLPSKGTPMQNVRLLYPQNAPRPQFTPPSGNSPRKVYIPISGPVNNQQNSAIRSQTIMLKPVPNPSSKVKTTAMPMVRMPQQSLGVRRVANTNRHPAPLPDCSKQYQPPNWKALPPAPDLRLSKVENGIVISWKIEGYQEDSYEEIASYQLFAYQEPPGPPSSSLWKKIGDVKALPLPMACTLTQFMAGFKYYFAVRAVDVRSRFGPFSLPGSILLLNKM